MRKKSGQEKTEHELRQEVAQKKKQDKVQAEVCVYHSNSCLQGTNLFFL